jgi:hypothetical protein
MPRLSATNAANNPRPQATGMPPPPPPAAAFQAPGAGAANPYPPYNPYGPTSSFQPSSAPGGSMSGPPQQAYGYGYGPQSQPPAPSPRWNGPPMGAQSQLPNVLPIMGAQGQILQEVLPGAGASVFEYPGQGLNVTTMKQTNPAGYQEALRRLDNRQYCLGTDASGSMTVPDVELVRGEPKVSRFGAVGEFACVMAETCKRHDKDGGLTIYEFGRRVTKRENAAPAQIKSIYGGQGPNSTDGTAMVSMARMFKDDVLAAWRGGNREPYSLVVFTDGEPSWESRTNPQQEIDAIISELAVEICKMGGDDESIAISFIQVGPDQEYNRATRNMEDTAATRFLKHLDDELGEIIANAMKAQGVRRPDGSLFQDKTFDIVDTKHLEQVKGMTADDVLIDGMIN